MTWILLSAPIDPNLSSELISAVLLNCYCKLLWLCIPEVMVRGQLRQGDCLKFEAKLDYNARLSQKTEWGRGNAIGIECQALKLAPQHLL